MSPPSVKENEEEQGVNCSGVEVWSVNVKHTISLHRGRGSAPEFSVLWQRTGFRNQTLIYKKNTWNVFGYEGFWDLNFTCIKSDILLSSFIDITKFGTLFFQLDLEHRVSVTEVEG